MKTRWIKKFIPPIKKGVEPTGVGELLPNREHAVRHVGDSNIIQKIIIVQYFFIFIKKSQQPLHC
jgi:hypothetical protein